MSVLSFVVAAMCLEWDQQKSGVRVGNQHLVWAVSPEQKGVLVLFLASEWATFLPLKHNF